MNRFATTFFAGFCLFLLSTIAVADTAWYYNPARSGEGIILTETADGRVAFSFYSHVQKGINKPPIVSPAPPKAIYCDEDTVWFTGLSDYWDDYLAEGALYYDVANDDFPVSKDGAVSKSIEIGRFTAARKSEGFVMVLSNNYLFCDLSLFGEKHYFVKKLTE
jgi:hypothetical protein